MRNLLIAVICASLWMLAGCGQFGAPKQPRVFYLDGAALVQTRARVQARDPALMPAMENVLRDAGEALLYTPVSVMDKKVAGPSGDKHDYVSYAPYYWPDPTKKDGLPYIRHDGYHNVALVREGDADRLKTMIQDVNALALAYWFTGDSAYSRHAGLLLRTWFLDPATRMNPNFNYAQAIRGITQGRGIGLIEFRGMYMLVDALGLLEGASGWSHSDAAAMHDWLERYCQWIRKSPNANEERHWPNNHGSWMAAQETALYLYLGHDDYARAVFATIPARIAHQVQPDGRQPLENVREDALGYSLGNLSGLGVVALLAHHEGLDLWHYETTDARSITRALQFLLPYFTHDRTWPYNQLRHLLPEQPLTLVLEATMVFKDPGYDWYLEELPPDAVAGNRGQLLFAGR